MRPERGLQQSLELRRAQWVEGDYEVTATTEVAYLFANGVRLARLAYEPDDEIPVLGGDKLHVFFELGDHLGSTSAAIDKATGELVERRTYEAYGSTESDYRPERWGSFREDYGFTGKEDDVEFGLTYFGRRFLSTNLNRWVSADPLTIHGLGGDLNAYAYVSGAVLRSVDPLGLNGEDADAALAAGQKVLEAGVHAAWEAGKAAEAATRAAHEQGGTASSANFGRETARVALEKTATGRAKAVLDTLNPVAKVDGIVAAASDPKAAAVEAVKALPVVSTVVAVHEVSTSLRARDANGFGTSIANGVLAVDDKAKELAVAAVSAGTAGAGRGVSNRPCPGNCFPAGTEVMTPDGLRPIESLAPGDLVLAMNENTGTLEWRPVEAVIVRLDRPVLTLELLDESWQVDELRVTPDHPVWKQGAGWVDAEQLRAGDRLLSADGTLVTVLSTAHSGIATETYNLTVSGYHTFFVGEAGVWVHNCRGKGPVHHIMTDKNSLSTARGGTPRFKAMAARAKVALGDAENKVRVPGHHGPHPQAYHEAVFDRLRGATKGLKGAKYASAFKAELAAIRADAATAGSTLNKLLVE